MLLLEPIASSTILQKLMLAYPDEVVQISKNFINMDTFMRESEFKQLYWRLKKVQENQKENVKHH